MPLTLRTMFESLIRVYPFKPNERPTALAFQLAARESRRPRPCARRREGATFRAGNLRIGSPPRTGRQVFLGCVTGGGGLDQGLDFLLIRLLPVAADLPALAIPGL